MNEFAMLVFTNFHKHASMNKRDPQLADKSISKTTDAHLIVRASMPTADGSTTINMLLEQARTKLQQRVGF